MDLFKEAQAAFTPIIGALNDDDVKRITKRFINPLQSIDVPSGAIDLSNLLLSYANHKDKHGVGSTFERMVIPLPAYNNSIASNATNAVRAKAERLWMVKIGLQTLTKTVERAGRTFLVAVVEDTLIPPLKEETTFYNKVPLRDFLARLKGGSGGLEATDIVSLLLATLGWWAEDPRVPKYVNKLEEAQRKSVRASLPIDDKWLAAIATSSLLAVDRFPKQRTDWDSLPRANKTWTAWKTAFRNHQLTLEREQRATEEQGGVFGSASAVTALHGITNATVRPGVHTSPNALAFHAASGPSSPHASNLLLQALDGHLDRMANAATNSGTTLSQITDANARLASATSSKYQRIKKTLTDIKNSNSFSPNPRSSSSGAGAGATNNQHTIRLLQPAIKNCWIVGGFCSSHGCRVGYLHSSATCKNKLAGHINSVTRSNPSGPGKTKNQGWDSFIT